MKTLSIPHIYDAKSNALYRAAQWIAEYVERGGKINYAETEDGVAFQFADVASDDPRLYGVVLDMISKHGKAE